MADQPSVPASPAPSEHFVLPLKAHKDLCVVRDELRLFATVSLRRAADHPKMLVCRQDLAHCFEHLAQRVDSILSLFDETSEEQATGVPSYRSRYKH